MGKLVEQTQHDEYIDDVNLGGLSLDDLVPASAAEEAAILRKLDLHILPLLFVLYSLSVLDRSNLGNAKLAGLEKDINLTGDRYNLLGTIFYIFCMSSLPFHTMETHPNVFQISVSSGQSWVGSSSSLTDGQLVLCSFGASWRASKQL